MLLGEVAGLWEADVKVDFWSVPPEYNEIADRRGREKAEKAD